MLSKLIVALEATEVHYWFLDTPAGDLTYLEHTSLGLLVALL